MSGVTQRGVKGHLIATYTGGLDPYDGQSSSADDAYTISWFPAAFENTPKVGKYVKWYVEWKP